MNFFDLVNKDLRGFLNQPSWNANRKSKAESAPPRLAVYETANGQWRSAIEEFGGNLYHSEEWAEISRSRHSRPLFFHWTGSDGRSAGIAVGIESRSRVPGLGRFSRRLNLESYPAVRDRDASLGRLLMEQLVAFAGSSGYRALSVQSYCSEMLIPGLDRLGFALANRTEFVLDLTQSTDALWKGLSGHHRRKIRKAEKHGLALKESTTADALEHLVLLLNSTSERRNTRGDQMVVLEKGFYMEKGKNLFSRNLGRLFLMTDNGVPVSAAFVTVYAGRAFYQWGGSSERGCAQNAPSLLFWNIFLRCREEGCTRFNLGGVPAEAVDPKSPAHGLYRFKSSFGGRPVRCVNGTIKNLHAFRGLLLAIAEKGRKALQSV